MAVFRIKRKPRTTATGRKEYDELEASLEAGGDPHDFSGYMSDYEPMRVEDRDHRNAVPCVWPIVQFLLTSPKRQVLIRSDDINTCREINYHSVGLKNYVPHESKEFL
eukprot:CAMPEP_0194051296 /NCGR_PEP_ID=MMETSP0009_2-20130614/39678_1 /TAXON_ID=210454 /ORGANISM="Grammatophora oceanica, Strain CCMP 410" /LENGTH=107 /DNA_ID=CAMNT_0038698325 /DNA_START=18 /DNA_END=337 /DNA_ORIENTATION=-